MACISGFHQVLESGILLASMEAPESKVSVPPRSRWISRRTFFRLVTGGAFAGLTFETARVLAGSNEHTVIPGKVYRSAQLSQEKLQRVIAEKKIRTVINLRGCCPDMAWYMGDARATHATGISQEDLSFSAKRYPHPGEVNRLIEVFDRTEYPVIMHCAAGADRTGLGQHHRAALAHGRRSSRRAAATVAALSGISRSAGPPISISFSTTTKAFSRRPALHTHPIDSESGLPKSYCPGPYRAELQDSFDDASEDAR